MTGRDDDDDRELERRMTEKLFGNEAPRRTVVEKRRSGKKKRPVPVVEVAATPTSLEHGGDDSHIITFVSVLPNGTRIPLKTIRAYHTVHPRAVIKEYEAEGRVVKWVTTNPEDDPD